MPKTHVQIATPDGSAAAYLSLPDGAGPWPGLLFFMDGFGPRPTLFAMADRLSALGYCVLLPDMYYRAAPYAPFDTKSVFTGGGPEFERAMKMIKSVDEGATRDTRAFLEFLERQPQVRADRVGATGYCLGGGLAVRAASDFPGRVKAAASFHGGGFVTDAASPDVLAKTAKAAFYLGVAEVDRRHTAEVTAKLTAAFTTAGAKHTIELYAGAAHGFAVPDLPPYNAAAADRHWERTATFFGDALA